MTKKPYIFKSVILLIVLALATSIPNIRKYFINLESKNVITLYIDNPSSEESNFKIENQNVKVMPQTGKLVFLKKNEINFKTKDQNNIINIIKFFQNPNFNFLKESKDQVVSGYGIPPTFILASLILYFIYRLASQRDSTKTKAFIFIFSSIYITCFLLMHAWLFKLPQMTRYHYSTTIMRPLIVILAFFLFYEIYLFLSAKYPQKKKQINVITYLGLFLFSFACLRFAVLQNYKYSKKNFANFTYDTRTIESIDWLKNHTESTDVVMTVSSEFNALSAMRTQLYQYIPGFHLSMAGFDERWERILYACRIFGVQPERLSTFLNIDNHLNFYFSGHSSNPAVPIPELFERTFFVVQPFHNYYTFTADNSSSDKLRAGLHITEFKRDLGSYVPLSHRRLILEKYETILSLPIKNVLEKYKVNYIVEYKNKEIISSIIDPEVAPYVRKVFSNDIVTIYEKK